MLKRYLRPRRARYKRNQHNINWGYSNIVQNFDIDVTYKILSCRRDRAAGCVSFGQSGRLELESNILRTLPIFNHCDIIGLQSYRIRWKKNAKWGPLLCSTSFKVIEIGTNRKPICKFLLVINSNWHSISYRFGVVATYCSNVGHCVFEPPFGGLGNVRCLS